MIYLNKNAYNGILSSFFTPMYKYAGSDKTNFELIGNYSSKNEYYNSKVRDNYGTLTIGNLIEWHPDKFFEKNFGIPGNEYYEILSQYPIGSVVIGYSIGENLNSYFGIKLNRTNNGQNELDANIDISPVLRKCLSGFLNGSAYSEVRKLGLAKYIINTVKKTADEYKGIQTYKVEYNNANVQFPQITPVPLIIVAIYPKNTTYDFTNDIFPDMKSKIINIWDGKKGIVFDNIYGSLQDIFNYAEDMPTPDELRYMTILPVLLDEETDSLYFEIYVPKYLFSNYNNGLEITFLDQTFRINSTVSHCNAENCDIVDSSNVTMSYRYSIFRKEITVDKIEALNLNSVLFTIKKILPFAKQYSTKYLEPSQLGVNLVKIKPGDLSKISYQPNSFFKMPYISNRLIYGNDSDDAKWFVLEKGFTETNIDDLSLATFKNPHMRSYSGLGSYFYDIGNIDSPIKINEIEKFDTLVEPTMKVDINVSDISDNFYIPDREYFNRPIKILNLILKSDMVNGLGDIKTFIGKGISQATIDISELSDKVSGFMVKKYIVSENSIAFACIFDRILSHIIIGNDVADSDNSIVISFFNRIFPKTVDVDIISDNFKVFKINDLNSEDIENKINNLDDMSDNANDVNSDNLYLPKLVLMLSLKHFTKDSPIYDILSGLNNIETDAFTGLTYSKLKYYNDGEDDKEYLYITGLEIGKNAIDIANIKSENPADFEKLIIVNDAFLNNSSVTSLYFPIPYIKTYVGNNVRSKLGYMNIREISGHPDQIYNFFKNDRGVNSWPTTLVSLKLYQSSEYEKYTMFSDISDYLKTVSPKLIDLNISLDYINSIDELKLDSIKNLTIRGYGDSTANLQYVTVGNIKCGYNLRSLNIENFSDTNLVYEVGSEPLKMSDALSIPRIEPYETEPYEYLYTVNLDENIHLEYVTLESIGLLVPSAVRLLPALCRDFENIKEYTGSFSYRIPYARYKHDGENRNYIIEYVNNFQGLLPNGATPKSLTTILTNVNPYTRNLSVTADTRKNTSWDSLKSSGFLTDGKNSNSNINSIVNMPIYSIPGLLDTILLNGQKPTYNSSVPFNKLKIYPSKETDAVSTYDGTTGYSYATYNILPVLSNQTYTAYKHGVKYQNRAYYLKELDISGVKFLDSMLNQAFSLEKLTYDPYKCVLSYDKELLDILDGISHRTIFTPYMKTTVEWKRVLGKLYLIVDSGEYIGSLLDTSMTIDKYYPITDFPAIVGTSQEPFISEYVSAFDDGYYGDKDNGKGFWEYQDCDNANRRSIFNIFIKYRYASMHINSSYTSRYIPQGFTTDDIVLMAMGLNRTSPSLINNVTLTVNSVGYDRKKDLNDTGKELYDRMIYVIGTPSSTSFNDRNNISLYLNGYNLLGYSFTGYDNNVTKFDSTISDGLNILSAKPDGFSTYGDKTTFNANYSIPISTYGVTKNTYGYNPVILGSFSGNLLKIRTDENPNDNTKVEETIFYSCIENNTDEDKYTMDAYLEVRLLPKTLKELHIKISKDDIVNNTYNGIEVDNVIYPVKNSTISLPEFKVSGYAHVKIYDGIYTVILYDLSYLKYVIICGNRYSSYNGEFTIPAQNKLPIINRIKIYTDELKLTFVEYFGENDTVSVGWYDYKIVNDKVNILGIEYDVDRITIVNGIDSNINKSLNLEGVFTNSYTWHDKYIDVKGYVYCDVETNTYLGHTIDAAKVYGIYYPVKRVVTIKNNEYSVSGLMNLGQRIGGIVLYDDGKQYYVRNKIDIDSYFKLIGSFGNYKIIIDNTTYDADISYDDYASTDYFLYGTVSVRTTNTSNNTTYNFTYDITIVGNNTTSPYVNITIPIEIKPGEDFYSIYIGNFTIYKIPDNFDGNIQYYGLDGYYHTSYVYGVVTIDDIKYKVKNSYVFDDEKRVISGYHSYIIASNSTDTYNISDGAVVIDGIKHYIDRSVKSRGYDTRRCDVIASEVIVGGEPISVESVYTDPDSNGLYTYAYVNGIIYKVKSIVTFGDEDINVVYKADNTIVMGEYTYRLYSRKLIYDGNEYPIEHYIKTDAGDLKVSVDDSSEEPDGTVEIDGTTYNVFFLDGIITYDETVYPVIDGHVLIGNVEYLAINNVVIIGGDRWPAFKDNSDSYTYLTFALFGRKYDVKKFTSYEHVLTENPIFYAKHDSLEHVYIEGCAFNSSMSVCGTNNLNILSDALLKNNSDLKLKITNLIEKYNGDFFTFYDYEIDRTNILKSYIIVHVDVDSPIDSPLDLFTEDGWFGYPGRVFLDPKTGLPPGSDTRDLYNVYASLNYLEIYAVGLEINNVNTGVKRNYILYTAYKRYYNLEKMPPNLPEDSYYYNDWRSYYIRVDDLLDPDEIS